MALHPLYAVCTLLHGFSFHLKAPLEGMFGLRDLFQIIKNKGILFVPDCAGVQNLDHLEF